MITVNTTNDYSIFTPPPSSHHPTAQQLCCSLYSEAESEKICLHKNNKPVTQITSTSQRWQVTRQPSFGKYETLKGVFNETRIYSLMGFAEDVIWHHFVINFFPAPPAISEFAKKIAQSVSYFLISKAAIFLCGLSEWESSRLESWSISLIKNDQFSLSFSFIEFFA